MQIRVEDKIVFGLESIKNSLFFNDKFFRNTHKVFRFSFLSGDMQEFLLPWFNSMKNVCGGGSST